MKVQFPHDFSGEISGRNCEGEFPEWEIPDEDMHIGGIQFSNIPQICETCPYVEVCCMQVSQILLMGIPHDRDQFNIASKMFGAFFDMSPQISSPKVTIIDEVSTTKKLR